VQAAFYAATHRPAEARGAVADARKSSPASSGSYEAEASLLDSEGKRDEALAAYVKATELGSTNGYVYYRLAALTWGTDPDEETLGRIETLLKRAVTLNDRFAPAYTLLADAVARGSQPSAALEFATKASALEPGEAAPRLARARVSWRLGRRDEARADALAARVLADSDQERKEVQQLLDFFDRASPK
jgi:tetratricopeptide (TPR) repeat protein